MLEISKYNYTVIDPFDNSYLLYNSLSGAIFRLSKTAIPEYEKIKKERMVEFDNNIRKVFEQYKVLVPPGLNQEEYIDYLRVEYVEDNKILDIMILVTEQCNLRCQYCYENFERGNITEESEQGIINYLKM